jgi:3-polyprenyl-4-hydroxybenzoate decarboxylase
MPAVRDLWSYGETGFHSLAAAVVRERYSREALGAGFRILGEGQLSLTKFLLLTDTAQDLRDFKALFEHVLARVDWETDFFIFSNTSFDTLDYASWKINHGSKAMLLGLGEAVRELKREFVGALPIGVKEAKVFCGGCLVVEGAEYEKDKTLPERMAKSNTFNEFQIVVLHDKIEYADSTEQFLWATWTRFNPSTDVYAKEALIKNNHIAYHAPIIIDARMKPWHPAEVETREDIAKLVDKRWREYFPQKQSWEK